jgi:hypothetical protein
MASHSRLGLTTPERTPGPENQIFLNLKGFEAWLSSLPMAHIGETSRQVFKVMVELNRSDIPYDKRAQTVELLRQPISYISKNLKKYFYDLPFPLSARNQKVAVLCRELHSELATSYKIIIEELLNDPEGRPDKQLLTTALHHAVFYLSRVLYYSAFVYNPYPGQVWKEIHLLYRYANQLKLGEIPIKDALNAKMETSTLSDLYRRVLLFGMASPYNLRQREIEYLVSNLPEWAHQITMTACKQQEPAGRAAGFLVQTAADEPPVHAALVTAPVTGGCLQIDTQALIPVLQERLQQLGTKAGTSGMQVADVQIAQSLLHKYLHTLAATPKRAFVRTNLNFELEIAIGLTAIHSLIVENLTAQTDNVDETENEELQTSEEITLSLSPLGPQFDESGYAPNTASGGWLQDQSAPSWANGSPEKRHTTVACKTFNESAGGYCIDLSGSNTQGIRVGELIGIQSATKRAQFSIGVTRWLRNIPALGLQIGVEILAVSADAIFVHPLDRGDDAQASQYALLLPEQQISKQPSSLIVQPFFHRVNDVIWVTVAGEQKQVRLTHLLEATGAFARFRYQPLDTAIRPEQPQKKAQPPQEFDNIWEKL